MAMSAMDIRQKVMFMGIDFMNNSLLYTVALDPVIEGRISASEYPEGASGGCCNDYDPAKNRDVYRAILSTFRLID